MEVTLKVTGMADNDVQVSQFISQLNASKLVRDVNLLQSEAFVQDKATLRRFQIEMMLNPDAEVRENPVATKVVAVEQAEGQ